MRELGIGFLVTGLCFAIGVSGAPSALLTRGAAWLEDRGTLEIRGPVGDAVKVAFPELDTADPGDTE